MRRYDDPVEVRRGLVPGSRGDLEGPEQFLWLGRLWKVRDVVAHWVETGPWWHSAQHGPHCPDGPGCPDGDGSRGGYDLLAEREVWRVEAGRGLAAVGESAGVFDLVFDGSRGSWQLARAVD